MRVYLQVTFEKEGRLKQRINMIKINQIILTSKQSVAPTKHTIICKGDTGASGHYFRESDVNVLTNVRKSPTQKIVHLPNEDFITSTKLGELPIPELSKTAKAVDIFPALTNASLISIS